MVTLSIPSSTVNRVPLTMFRTLPNTVASTTEPIGKTTLNTPCALVVTVVVKLSQWKNTEVKSTSSAPIIESETSELVAL